MSNISWFLLALTGVFALLIIYPYLIYPVILKFLPKKSIVKNTLAIDSGQNVALLFCAYNEEKSLSNKIKNIRELKQKYPDLKVYAYSDGSTDKTNEILENVNDMMHVVIGHERLGKVLGMQKLVSMVKEEIIIFTDANVLLTPESIKNLQQYFTDPEVGCVSGKLMYKGMHSTTAKVGGIYWKMEEKIKQLETETGSTMGADGAVFARRRKGYPILPPYLVDDMAASLSVLFDNERCISVTDVIAYENAVNDSQEEFNRKIRIACGAYSTYLYQKENIKQAGLLDRFKFISHKLIRWWGAFFMLFANITFLLWGYSIGYGHELLVTLAAASILFWQLGKNGTPIIAAIYEVVVSIIATGIGVIQSKKGSEYRAWETASTR